MQTRSRYPNNYQGSDAGESSMSPSPTGLPPSVLTAGSSLVRERESSPNEDSSPPILSPMPRSFRDRWVSDKQHKLNRSPDLKGGNGFEEPPAFSLVGSSSSSSTRHDHHGLLPRRGSGGSALRLSNYLSWIRRKFLTKPKTILLLVFALAVFLIRRAAIDDADPSGASWFLAPIYLKPPSSFYPNGKIRGAGGDDEAYGQSEALSPVPSLVVDRDEHRVIQGMLEVNMDAPASHHPIYTLIDNAKDAWQDKLARQSKTLEEAVNEYKRRNGGLPPPKGFDHWWKYCQVNSVHLPDEYDRINIDLAPFRAMSSSLLRSRLARIQTSEDTFTLSVKNGHVDTNHITYDSAKIGGSDDRRNGQVELIRSVARWIPDFDAVYSIHDSPTRFISDAHLEDLKILAEDGEYLDPSTEMDTSMVGWVAACPPGSKLRNMKVAGVDIPLPKPNANKSFIVSHVQAMDICENPEILNLHGSTAGVEPHTQGELFPIFSLSKTRFHADILGIPVEQWGEDLSREVTAWETKSDARLLWRGRNTGGYFSKETQWRNSHRARLTSMVSLNATDKVLVLPPPHNAAESQRSLKEAMKVQDRSQLNEVMFDIGLAYEPIQCNIEDGTCDEITEELTFRPVRTFEEENHYKYILDVDGNAWSARFKRVLTSGAMVLKSTIYPEWWNDRVQPWLHYVPVKVDYSDLYDIVAFFRGDDEQGITGEDALAKMIAANGRNWSSKHWRKEDMTAYMFRLYLEWARLVSPKRGTMNFEYIAEPVNIIPASEAQTVRRPPPPQRPIDPLEALRVKKAANKAAKAAEAAAEAEKDD